LKLVPKTRARAAGDGGPLARQRSVARREPHRLDLGAPRIPKAPRLPRFSEAPAPKRTTRRPSARTLLGIACGLGLGVAGAALFGFL